MTPDWQSVRSAFERLLDLADPERERALEEIEREDRELARELRELLRHDSSSAGLYERDAAQAPLPARFQPERGAVIGGYRLERPLGSGGMGTVWEATRRDPDRRVALKLMGTSAWSRSDRWRFLQETRVLARMNHPGIAVLYEAATSATPGGGELAWFAMELVEDARDLVTWLDERGAGPSERLASFRELCEAVLYGHGRGVIHRDLKPSNVLVGPEGRVKLIDFGVARPLGPSEATPSLRTQTGELVGTLQYMAPEQVGGRAAELDVRCDVYALGVILYRLLVGAPPFDFGDAGLAEIARRIVEEEPRRPSALSKNLAGDLEWILLRMLEKDPARRYGSVAEVLEDLRRFEAHEPVRAGPPSALYRMRKFVRRNRALVAVSGAVAVGVAVAVAGLASGLRRARAGEQRAMRGERVAKDEVERGRRVLGLVEAMFEGIEDSTEGRDVRVLDMLESAALREAAELKDDPAVEFTLRAVRGKIFWRLKRYREARRELERAVELYPSTLREEHDRERLCAVQAVLGSSLAKDGEPERGEALMREALATAETVGFASARTLAARALLGHLNDKGANAELLERSSSLRRQALDQDDPYLALDAGTLAGLALLGLGRATEAVPILEQVLAESRELRGERNMHSVTALFNLATALQGAGELDRAEEVFPEAVRLASEVFGPSHAQTLTTLNNHAYLAMQRGDLGASADRFRAVVEAFDASGRPPTVEHMIAVNNLGMLLGRLGDPEAAEPVLRRGVELAGELLAPDDVNGMQFRFNYAACLARIGRWEEAEPALLEAQRELAEALPADHPVLQGAARTLAQAYEHHGAPEEAARWREDR